MSPQLNMWTTQAFSKSQNPSRQPSKEKFQPRDQSENLPVPLVQKEDGSSAGAAIEHIGLLPIASGDMDAEGYEIVKWPGGKPHYEGEAVVAQIITGARDRKLRMEVNQLGEYPRVQVQAGEKLQVKMLFQSSPSGMPVALSAQDGGSLDGGKTTQSVFLADDRTTSFEFTAGENDGVHRVTVRTASGEVKNFDFWVGPLNVMRNTALR